MARAGLAAYLVPSTDPHQSEYVPACWQRRAWLSGFSGSAGDLVVTRTSAGLWTDGRYFLQAAQELRGSGIKLFKQGVKGVPGVATWLARNLQKGETLGGDPKVLSRPVEVELRAAVERAGARLKLLEDNLVDRIWRDRPPPSRAPIEVLPLALTGEGAGAKLQRLRKIMQERRAAAHVLTALDAIAWLFNIRGKDVEFNPVAIAHALIEPARARLFIDPQKVPAAVRRALGRSVELQPYEAMGPELVRLARSKARVWVDARTVNAWVLQKLRGCELIVEASPIALMKARKNAAEVAGMRAAHRRDGVALARFFCWLEQEVPGGTVSELSAVARLHELRAAGESFRGESFATIAAYAAHGAIIHYNPSPASDVRLRPEGLFLLDSGGQYLDGTTDVTRTVLLGGEATPEQRDRFTRVVKGHVALARCRFPAGTAGRQIDVLARLPLWSVGLDYAHGTGHGVGAYLNVHEGPQAISPTRCIGVPLEAGNILSNEPGFYREGEYGIRVENLILTVEDQELSQPGAPFLRFETLTLCPIDRRLLDLELLDAAERRWLDDYHARVREEISPALEPRERAWLAAATAPL
jgi:Xaa-Pro aminopeptidase